MDNFQSQTRKGLFKCQKKRLTQDQVRLLEGSFNVNNKLDADSKSQLAQQLGLPPRQIAIWYQNKRARRKSQSLEVDHKAMHERLEEVLSDNERLREEVQKAQEMLQVAAAVAPYSCSSGDEAGGSLGLLHGSSKELYACLLDEHESQFGTSPADLLHNFFAPPGLS
ncbi:PREDICTED: homeobox-leucine zipper protein ATHB-52-like [Ipomoea nil]|uniref:homeobox-leucine zipper protein ATHB-52-like n=1 Tax=Ipomoea nil TaxID=35883 RepID=UPI0009013291|nr:PREDICTED: homeobox-leucine zipper protein ATHB-52-like [Ipomoea nil]